MVLYHTCISLCNSLTVTSDFYPVYTSMWVVQRMPSMSTPQLSFLFPVYSTNQSHVISGIVPDTKATTVNEAKFFPPWSWLWRTFALSFYRHYLLPLWGFKSGPNIIFSKKKKKSEDCEGVKKKTHLFSAAEKPEYLKNSRGECLVTWNSQLSPHWNSKQFHHLTSTI